MWYETDTTIVFAACPRFTTLQVNRPKVVHQYATLSQRRHIQLDDDVTDFASRGVLRASQLRIWLAGRTFPHIYIPHPTHLLLLSLDGVEFKKR